MIIEKLSETQIAIIDEISRAFDRLGAERGIFAALHSWGDTMSDLEVLQMLKEQNQMMTTSSIPLQRELEALLLDDKLTQEQRARMKWDYIVEKNDRLSLENQALKLWIGSLLAADGFDNGCYDSQNLRIARDKLKEILANPIRF